MRTVREEFEAALAAGERDFRGWDLRHQDLRDVVIEGASFERAKLDWVDFGGAILRDVTFDDAKLFRAYFLDAKCAGSHFRNAHLEGAFFQAADLSDCDFTNANLTHADLAGANLQRAVLSDAALTTTSLASAKLDETRLNATMCGALLVGLDLTPTLSLGEAVHAGTSFIDFSTLRKTAKGLAGGPGRRAVVKQFFADAGLGEQEFVYFHSLLPPENTGGPVPLLRSAASIEETIARDPLREFFVMWDDIGADDVDDFERALDEAESEREMQAFLAANPKLLVQHLGGGHGRWVIPQKRLGSEKVPDFLIGERDSAGFHWQLVELESPTKGLFTKAGVEGKELRQAIRQVRDWRTWLSNNLDYARRAREDDGLGLRDIDAESPGLILIGRRGGPPVPRRGFRRRISAESNIRINSYDFLVEAARGRVADLGRRR